MAQGASPPWEAKARALVKEGQKLQRRGDDAKALGRYQSALVLLQQHHKHNKAPEKRLAARITRLGLLYLIGRTQLARKRWADADRRFRRCQVLFKRTLSQARALVSGAAEPAQKKRYNKHMAKLRQLQALLAKGRAALAPHLRGQIEIDSTPAGATISLRGPDGQLIQGKTPFRKGLLAGRYQLTLRRKEYSGVERQIELRPGRSLQMMFGLRALFGHLTIKSQPRRAQVAIYRGNQLVHKGQAPLSKRLPTGAYEVRLQLPAYAEKKIQLALRPQAQLIRIEKLARSARYLARKQYARDMVTYQKKHDAYRGERSFAKVMLLVAGLTGAAFTLAGVGLAFVKPEDGNNPALGSGIMLTVGIGFLVAGTIYGVVVFRKKAPRKPTLPNVLQEPPPAQGQGMVWRSSHF